MHPIHYSLAINALALIICGALAYLLAAPWLVVVCLFTQAHIAERFQSARRDEQEDENDNDERPMGFTASLKNNR